jgi:branched-chain amino acid transport system permease protein
METTKSRATSSHEIHTPELVDNWILVTTVEAVILVLLSPALFRIGLFWGLAAIIFVLFLLGAIYTWRKGKHTGYHFFKILYFISMLALVGALITFLSIASAPVSLIFLIGIYLAGYLRRREQRGYAFVIQAIVAVMAIISLISAPAEERRQIYVLLACLALYLFCGGAVRFYFGHTFAELNRTDVLDYFGYNKVPVFWQRLAQVFNYPAQWLQGIDKLLDSTAGSLTGLLGKVGKSMQQRRRSGPASYNQRTRQAIIIIPAVLIFPYFIRQLENATDLSILISLNVGLLFVVLALGLNIVVGFAGLLDLGYAAFFAIGAYTVGIFTWPNLGLEWSFWLVILLSTVVAAIFGMIIGAPTLRLRGDYLAIVTLAFGEIVPRAIRELWDIKIKIPFTDIYLISAEGFFYNSQGELVEGFNLTNGPQGMNPVGRPTIFGFEIGGSSLQLGPLEISPPVQWYFLIAIIGAVVLLASFRLQQSRLGRAWMAIREDEVAADTMGVDPVRTKLLAFALGASFSGFAGSIYAGMIQAIFPELFSFLVSIFLLIIVIVSGMGNIWGVLVGGLMIAMFDRVVLAQIVPQFVPGGDILQSWRWVMYAAGLIAIMVLRPEGLFPSSARKAELHAAEEELSEAEIAAVLEQEKREAKVGL